jgi:hypothetical protein
MDKIIFLVTREGFTVNVIVETTDRESAKCHADHFLGGDPDRYVVTPLTKPGDNTVFLVGGG